MYRTLEWHMSVQTREKQAHVSRRCVGSRHRRMNLPLCATVFCGTLTAMAVSKRIQQQLMKTRAPAGLVPSDGRVCREASPWARRESSWARSAATQHKIKNGEPGNTRETLQLSAHTVKKRCAGGVISWTWAQRERHRCCTRCRGPVGT